MQTTRTLCDIVLTGAEDSSFGIPCHRVVLSAHSSYFRAMFTTDMKESSEPNVQFKNISTSTLYELISYAYTLEFEPSADNVQLVLTAALFLDILPVAKKCWDFVAERMNISNCLMVHCLADQLNNPPLARKSKAMVLRNFSQISESADFLLITAEKMVDLIGSDDLRVEKEDDVLDAVMRWLDYDHAGRKAHVSDVMQFVRIDFLSLTPRENLNGFMNSPAAALSLESRSTGALSNHRADAITVRCRPRESYGVPKAVICVGQLNPKENGKKTRMALMMFIPATSVVQRLTYLPENFDGPALGMLENGIILACGGRSKGLSERRVWLYDTSSNTWNERQEMREKRYGAGVVALNGRIYVVGGVDRRARTRGRRVTSVSLSSVEVYNPTQNKWKLVAPLPVALLDFGLVVFDNRLLYSEEKLQNQKRRTDMPTERRSCTACVSPSGLIYVIGRSADAAETGQCVEAYDAATDQWHKKKNMIVNRYSAVSACVGGTIYVVGGVDEPEEYVENTSIEYYDEDTDTWTLHSCQMPEERELTGCAVMTLNAGKSL
ncbi:kelch-like protein 5 [Paramacrobiotus metropolitanus]|uniref:kelch-like protein 5 n=1 Tax=Paramacrobiotus metropolitanus TaxID=2943436 RepID=UPI002445602B|nr:kelch-like protein 5 [Paramacrobiotus metropolitanus]